MFNVRSDVVWPIIYVRGYAMSQSEIDQTTADPFCGFNIGSTVYRATPDKKAQPKKFVFESPVVRLGRDFGYSGVYDNGLDIVDKDWSGESIPRGSIVVFRYYDEASRLLGTGKTPPISQFAQELGVLIAHVRDLVCAHDPMIDAKKFRCYLVAHSMGGLVCRAFLQNADEELRRLVDKVFTYATPHNGIDMGGFNVPPWLTVNDIDNFNRDNIANYLKISDHYEKHGRVDWLPEEVFRSERFFCMIGTNRNDYEAAKGLSRTFAGHGSDGLVRIENASVWGVDDKGKISVPCATAYAHRSHSGHFGIVNSEEAYQNLTRFLFGDVRVDIWIDVTDVRLPADVEAKAKAGEDIKALYQFEVLASPRGKRWYLTRRVAEEDSVACRTHAQLAGDTSADKSIYLSTVFLANYGKVNSKDDSLSYAVTIGVRVPDYEIGGRFWNQEHYEGGYLFRDTVIIVIDPPAAGGSKWKIQSTWGATGKPHTQEFSADELANGQPPQIRLPFDDARVPGIAGELRFLVRAWNTDHGDASDSASPAASPT